jgi:Uma2 family endonuclease
MQRAYSPTLYQQLEALPEGLTGEILNGQLHTQPRPAGPHARAETELSIDIGSAYGRGRGGPGGWWILVEPEIHFVIDQEVAVPDLAGWRRERMPAIPQGHRFTVVPDWVCEILSPATASKDREIKMPLYARYGVGHAWLLDPRARTLEVYRLGDGEWRCIAEASDTDRRALEPFVALELDLSNLWT